VGEAWQDNDLVFPTEIGTPWDPANFRRTFTRITQEAGIGKWTPNELRHSAVSFMSADGATLEEIADVVGHDSTRMTAGVYRHLLEPVVSAGVAPMERLLADD
jgi:site-specific recombinase XerD